MNVLAVKCCQNVMGNLFAWEAPVNMVSLYMTHICMYFTFQAAVKYLCNQGDPLGILPYIAAVPLLTRWFEIRRGVKLKLTQEDKG